MNLLMFTTIASSVLLCLYCALAEKPAGTTRRTLCERNQALAQSTEQPGFVTVKGDKFIDAWGRELMLHGTNIVNKSREDNYLSWHGPEEFAKMREWGFNCIRLGIIWDGLEPEPGYYNDEYLACVDKRVQWARENGIYVVLDMHQDLFSAKFGGNGAPDWATIDNGRPHIHIGGSWNMAYFTSPAVHAAFNNFWANKPASDGLGIQDHFARAWQHVAQRYANETAIVGYDIFNEPFPGSAMVKTLAVKMKTAAKIIARRQGNGILGVVKLIQKLINLNALRKCADDIDIYRASVDSGVSISRNFERTNLASFYRRVSRAIRRVDRDHILFLETHVICNNGTPSGITPVVNQNGDRDILQAFAPHGYDIVTDTDAVAEASKERLELIYDRHAETAGRLEMPVLVGEWGAFYGQPGTLRVAQIIVRQFEKHLFSDTYWSYGNSKEMEDAPYFPVIERPYPAAIAGTLLHCRSNLEEHVFSCAWRENSATTAPTHIYLPTQWFPEGCTVHLEPEAEGWHIEPITTESTNGYLVIPAAGQDVERSLRVEMP